MAPSFIRQHVGRNSIAYCAVSSNLWLGGFIYIPDLPRLRLAQYAALLRPTY